MGQKLREVREALAAARAGEANPPSATPTADELEALVRSLQADASAPPALPVAGVPAETPPVPKA